MESTGAPQSDEGRNGEKQSEHLASASDLSDDQIFMRMRSDAMYELRKLKHQHKPVSDFGGKKLLEEHFQRFSAQKSAPPASADGTGGGVSNRTKQFRDTEAAGRNARAPMPDSIRLEISGLFERHRVSEVLQSPELVQGIERAVRDGAERHTNRRRTRRPRPQPAEPAVRPHPRPRVRARARPLPPNGQYPTPSRDQTRILEQVRSSPALNSLGPEARERVVAEIGGLVQQQLVSSALTGEFRGVLELHIRERAERVADGVGVEQLMENLHRRTEHSEAASAAHSNMSSGSSLSDLKQEMIEMKAQLLEMKQLMRLSFDLQLDIQRSIRQEVAAAFSTQCLPPPASFGQPSTEGNQVNVHLVQSGHCTICSEASIDAVIYRCGHMCVCMSCGMELKAQGLKCPICRAPITDLIRAYASMC